MRLRRAHDEIEPLRQHHDQREHNAIATRLRQHTLPCSFINVMLLRVLQLIPTYTCGGDLQFIIRVFFFLNSLFTII